MAESWTDKVAVVTGGASGIGRASAIAFAKRGAAVVVADVQDDAGCETAAMIERDGGKAIYVHTDVSSSADAQRLIKTAVDTFGRIDFAHNNAGIEGVKARTGDTTEDNWHRVIAINLTGVFLCMKYELQQMMQQQRGAIVNTASVAGLSGLGGFPAYSASKHGIVGLTRTAALEYAKRGIRINAICPGPVDTPMLDRTVQGRPEDKGYLLAVCPLGRFASPEEVATTAVWLCSDEASFMTGHALAVDGGCMAF